MGHPPFAIFSIAKLRLVDAKLAKRYDPSSFAAIQHALACRIVELSNCHPLHSFFACPFAVSPAWEN